MDNATGNEIRIICVLSQPLYVEAGVSLLVAIHTHALSFNFQT